MASPFTPERWRDFWANFKSEPQQLAGIEELRQAMAQRMPEYLSEEASWVRNFHKQLEAPTAAPPPYAGTVANFNPAGAEEAGMIGPKKAPTLQPNDSYLLVNDRDEDMEAYDANKKLLWRVPALARGQGGDREWRQARTDTPPGLYKLGQVYDDRTPGNAPPAYDRTHLAYGWVTFDMVDLEGNEDGSGRAGICLHGGGSGCGWPGAWAPKQPLLPTFGCVRVHNSTLSELILPLYKKGTVYVGVWQEA